VTHRVVIVGCGFGGLFAAKALRHAPVEVVVVDRTNHRLFQPLLYQVATGVLSEGDIAPPIRAARLQIAGWLMWLFVHLAFMTGFKNRMSALAVWTIAFLGRGRRQRTITKQQVLARISALEAQDAHERRPERQLEKAGAR
jgi:NADH dehydrogenase FAD-containing subunit